MTSMTRAEFYFKVAPLVAQIGDGHTSISPPNEEYTYFRSQQKGLAFPFNVAYDTLSGVTITRNYSPDSVFSLGDQIVSINGHSADSLFTLFMSGASGERMAFRERCVALSFRMLLWLKNILSPYNLLIQRHKSQEQITRNIAGVTSQNVLKTDSLFAMWSNALPNYRFERLQDNIGYIDFRSMMDLAGFRTFLSTTFTDVQVHPVRGLIIDLRSNGGGSSQLSSETSLFPNRFILSDV